MTDVLRHAQPSQRTIEIDVKGGDARLQVRNDGALPGDGSDPGTGLIALRVVARTWMATFRRHGRGPARPVRLSTNPG